MQTLNPQQKIAVDSIDGPVMVIAGPGTGKTEILASRIAKILQSTDSHAENILCMTFTEAGTVAMRKRLIQKIGNDAHRIGVYTYHSFCNKVIQENPEEFLFRTYQPVSELERVELLHDLVANLPEEHRLKKMKHNFGYLVGYLTSLFSFMKKENTTADQMAQFASDKKEEIRTSDAFIYKRKSGENMPGDLKMGAINKIETRIDDLTAGAELMDVYTERMSKMGRYDYQDMILWVLDLFSKSKATLTSYQERYHYILVDEYQDTNGAQNGLLNHLISYWENPNVFVVGDDDQSIFRFQGAEVQNILDFSDRYQKNLVTVLLQTNYRSTQKILDVAKVHIDLNNQRLVSLLPGLDKSLITADLNNIGGEVRVVKNTNQFNEAAWLAKEIQVLLDSGENGGEIAIIYRNHAHAEQAAKVLAYSNIPVFFHRTEDVLHSESVTHLLKILRYVHAENEFPYSGQEFLFELMHIPTFQLASITCARVSHYIFKHRLRWRVFFADLEEDNLENLPLSEGEKTSVKAFSRFLEELLAKALSLPLLSFVDYVLQHSRISQRFISNSYQLECLTTFLSYLEQECSSEPRLSLANFLQKLDLMDSYSIAMPKERILYDQDGVQMMTAHASKGLEFKHVYIINCSGKAWEKETKRSPLGFINIFDHDDESGSEEEKRRLFYVAMTRAEKKLSMSYFSNDNKGKEVVRSTFLDNICLAGLAKEEEVNLDPLYAEQLLTDITFKPLLKKEELLDDGLIESYLLNYQLSPSHLNSYLECPTAFYFQQILRVPSAKNKYMSFGTAVHRALDQLFKAKIKNSDEFNSNYLRKQYEINLLRERYVFTDKEYEDFLSLGQNVLTEYFNDRSLYWSSRQDLRPEVTIDQIEIDGVPVKGQIDLMDVDGKTVQVVDFKTGDAAKSTPRLKPPKEHSTSDDSLEEQHGGPYWRQMMFYALIIRNYRKSPMTMVSGTFEFIEPDKEGQFQLKRIVIDVQGLEHMQMLIKDVYSRIRAKQFIEGCGKETCPWCSFVSENRNKNEA